MKDIKHKFIVTKSIYYVVGEYMVLYVIHKTVVIFYVMKDHTSLCKLPN